MKLMIASDLHGSAYYWEQLLAVLPGGGAGGPPLLGDLLYHGPWNDLPRDYAPKRVIKLLNGVKEHLLCVRGNCDTEVDQMVLDFPILAEYGLLGQRPCALCRSRPPRCRRRRGPSCWGGHTHVPAWEMRDGVRYVNPGSVSIPKENSPHSYLTVEHRQFQWKTLEGAVWKREAL